MYDSLLSPHAYFPILHRNRRLNWACACPGKNYISQPPLQLIVFLELSLINGMFAETLAAPDKFSSTR